MRPKRPIKATYECRLFVMIWTKINYCLPLAIGIIGAQKASVCHALFGTACLFIHPNSVIHGEINFTCMY